MILNDFIWKYNGKYIDYDHAYGYQCVDLIRQKTKDVDGFESYTAIPAGANAITIWNNFKDNKYYKKVLNGPTNVPKKGNIMFFKFYPLLYGFSGHTAVFCDGDIYSVISFDQNWPTGTPCHLQKHGSSKLLHGYRGCVGWLTPR